MYNLYTNFPFAKQVVDIIWFKGDSCVHFLSDMCAVIYQIMI